MESDSDPVAGTGEQDRAPSAATFDEAGFAESIWQHRSRLLRVARRILRNEDDAEDALQDAYLNAIRHCRRFAGRSTYLTWLTRIVVNQAVGQLRRNRKHPTIQRTSSCDSADGVICVSETHDPEQRVLHIERHRELRTALQKIPAKYRIAIQLRQLEEMSVEETAKWLGTSAACIKTRLHRAQHLLRRYCRGDSLAE